MSNLNVVPTARLASVGVATPPHVVDQPRVDKFLTANYANALSPRMLGVMHKVVAHPSVRRRHLAVEHEDSLVNEDPDVRVARFTQWGVSLSEQAARAALEKAGIEPDRVSAVVVNTCTGYICPGISTYLVERMGLRRDTSAIDLVGTGCGGAIPNLQVGGAMLNGSAGKVVLSVSVEICSATFQMGDNMSLVISNALFADGAGACVLWREPKGLEIIASSSLHVPEEREAVRYIHRGGELHNQLSPRLPAILQQPVSRVVASLLEPRGLRVADVRHWAIHPGGDKVITAIKETLGLSEEQLAITRGVLSNYGNVSSASVWFALDGVLSNGIAPGDWCVMLAAGAGLSVHGCLLRM